MAQTTAHNSTPQHAQLMLPCAAVRELEALHERIKPLEADMQVMNWALEHPTGVEPEDLRQGLEELRQRVETLRAEFLQLLGLRHELPDLDNISRLVERHGGQRTVLHTQIAEACTREVEALLGTRGPSKIGEALPRLTVWAASLGSPLLARLSYLLALLLLLDKLLDTVAETTPVVTRRLIRDRLPPPALPLVRIPTIQPNAPNLTA